MNCPVSFSCGNYDGAAIEMVYVMPLSKGFSLQQQNVIEKPF